MHVLSVIHYPVFGGPHNRNASVIPQLRRHGVETTILLPDQPGNAVELLSARDVRVITMPLQRLRRTSDLGVQAALVAAFRDDVRRLRGLIRRERVELVLINGLVNPHAAIAAHLENVPVVWQLLDTFAPMLLRRMMMPLVVAMADSVMSSGMGVAKEHPGATAFGDRLVSFFSIVDCDRFHNSPAARARAREELGLAPNDVVIGNVNNLNPMKGHDTFVRAAAALLQLRPGLRFVILGAQYDQHKDYTRALWREAAALGLHPGDRLIVVDPRDRVASLAPAFDVFWLTSKPRSEGVSTVVGEAMALELPVVATDVGSVREAVDDLVTGYLVPAEAPEALARATLPLIDDSGLRHAMGRAGRVRAKALYSLGSCADQHLAAFASAVQHRQARTLSFMRSNPTAAGPHPARPRR